MCSSKEIFWLLLLLIIYLPVSCIRLETVPLSHPSSPLLIGRAQTIARTGEVRGRGSYQNSGKVAVWRGPLEDAE